MSAEEPTAQTLKAEMEKRPTLDAFFTRNPVEVDWPTLVARERDNRALFIAKGEMVRTPKDEE